MVRKPTTFQTVLGLFKKAKTKQCKMTKEIRQDLYTQNEYAKLKGITRARVNQLVKAGDLQTLTVKGATLIKV